MNASRKLINILYFTKKTLASLPVNSVVASTISGLETLDGHSIFRLILHHGERFDLLINKRNV